MALYVDTSALLKRYVEEPDSDLAEAYLLADTEWWSGRHTVVETRRNIVLAVREPDRRSTREAFEEDWRRMGVIELDEVTCSLAADIGEMTGVRSLDALHLGAASRLGPNFLTFLTFDIRQAQAARTLGFATLGV
ncbi:MAG: type II toxin-antitoxin system VapC family toxin [Myxococcota bacterium]